MVSRIIAAAIIATSVTLAWLATANPLATRALQVLIAVSVIYTAYVGWQGWRVMRRAHAHAASGAGLPTGDARGLPFLSLLVPAKDEAPVIAQVTQDLASQRYAAAGVPRFEVIVIDDGSSDGTGDAARAVAREMEGRVKILRREPGTGPATRGAALNHATPAARGEVIAAIDADARVAPDFAERAIRAWSRDPEAAALQAQKRPTNPERSWVTATQGDELLLDMASQCGRWVMGGTAELRGNGMFIRRETLERLGGWGEEVLTEDLDMSTRLAAAGEHVTLAPEANVGEEAVDSPAMMWPQRMRWAEGSIRRLTEHGPGLLTGRLPIRRKLDFIAWFAEFLVPPLFVASLGAMLVALLARGVPDLTVVASIIVGYGLGTFSLAVSGLAADGHRGLRLVGRSLRAALFLGLWIAVVPVALLRVAVGSGRIRYVKTPRIATGSKHPADR